jgi:internalin A
VQAVGGLENLVNLVELDLSGNMVSEVSGLEHCQHLQKLVLARNRISHVDNLWTLMKLEHLLLQGNPIATIGNLNLQNLYKLPRLSTLYLQAVNGSEVHLKPCI